MYMKKIFLSAVIALALCSYGYAQDEEEYEEDEAPAKVTKAPAYEEEEEEEEEAAPVAKKAEKKKEKKEKKSSGDTPFFGVGVDLVGSLQNNLNLRLAFKVNKSIEVAALLGMWHGGATTTKTKATGDENTGNDNYTNISIGAAFDYLLATNFLPLSVGGEFIFSMPRGFGTDEGTVVANNDNTITEIQFNILAGGEAELIKGLTLNGKVGLGIDYWSLDTPEQESSRMDIGFVTRVYFTWYMF